MTQQAELLLYNYLHRNDSKMCYFQGLNFIAVHIVEMFTEDVDRLNCIEHVITNIFGVVSRSPSGVHQQQDIQGWPGNVHHVLLPGQDLRDAREETVLPHAERRPRGSTILSEPNHHYLHMEQRYWSSRLEALSFGLGQSDTSRLL